MRTLKFIVNGQGLRPDPECNFDGITKGTEGYLTAEFHFSEDWDNLVKVVEFSSGPAEYEPHALNSENRCVIPEEVLRRSAFNIRIVGGKSNFRIVTNKLTIRQEGELGWV